MRAFEDKNSVHKDFSIDSRIQRKLVLDERFDLMLYQKFRTMTRGDFRIFLDELIRIEKGHVEFWESFFGLYGISLDFRRRVALFLMSAVGRIFGEKGIHLILEAIEINGIRTYLLLWEMHHDTPIGNAIGDILKDELEHESELVSRMKEKSIRPEWVRGIFLGFNDGVVEMLGAVSGFFAAFDHMSSVLLAACTVAVAGAFSMGAGAFVAANSEKEVRGIEERRKRFLGTSEGSEAYRGGALAEGAVVGIFYLFGAMVPILPVFLGFPRMIFSVIAAGIVIMLISLVIAFLSGMDVKRRILLNVFIVAGAAGITYMIGVFARQVWGIAV